MLTDSARNKILELLADFGIGFYTDRAEIEAEIQNVDGLEIVYAVADDDKARFVGKVIDYQDGFVLRSADI